ncbi:(Fe-S)-binding protein [Anaerobacillus sp. HL2]|nr:(Fe-S)-binding protein [Anaerobacillus sp. HL2]
MKAVPGIILKQQENATRCCGSIGTYNLVHYDESMEILDQKMKTVVETKAEIIVTTTRLSLTNEARRKESINQEK